MLWLFLDRMLWQFDFEAMPGQDGRSVDQEFRFMAFWERPPFWVRFKPNQRLCSEKKVGNRQH